MNDHCTKKCYVKIEFIINFPSFLFYHYISNVIKKKEKKLWNSRKAGITTHTHIVRKHKHSNTPPSERFVSIQCTIWHVWCVMCNLTEEYFCFFFGCFLFENVQYPSPMSTCYENSGECVVHWFILFLYYAGVKLFSLNNKSHSF